MRIKNAFRILLSNVSTLYKIVLYRFICFAVFALIGYFAVLSDLRPLIYAQETLALRDAIVSLLQRFLSGNGLETELLRPAFDAFAKMIITERQNLIWVVSETGLMIVVLRFVCECGDYAFATLLDGFMSSMNKPLFLPTFFSTPGKTALYAFISTVLNLAADCVIFTAAIGISVYTLSYISIFAIIISAAVLVFGLSLKHTLLSAFLPNIVCGKKSVGRAFINTVPSERNFSTLLGGYSFMLLLFFYINLSFGMFTLYIGLIVSVPLTSLYFTAIRLVDYYMMSGRSYYVDYDTVVAPREKRKNADLLTYL